MSRYVIDENVFENAITNKKSDGSNAAAEKIFTWKFFSSTDTMFINNKIKTKFEKKLPAKIATKYRSTDLDNHVIPLLKKIIVDPSRTHMVDGIKIEFKGVKDCDVEFVGVTLQSQATLVTADGDLKAAMAKDKLVSKCDCRTVEEIIDFDHDESK